MAEITPKDGLVRPQQSERTSERASVRVGAEPTGGNGLAWVAVVISLAALGVGGYAWWQNAVNAGAESAGQVERVDARVNALEQRFDALSSARRDARGEVDQIMGQLGVVEEIWAARIDKLRDEILKQRVEAAVGEDELRRDVRVLSDSMVELRADFGGRDVERRRLWESEQLMVFANQRLQLSADVELVGKALKLADGHLRRLSDSFLGPAIRPVREILADEIALLENAATVDVAGTLGALSALARGLDELPLAGDVRGDIRGDIQGRIPDHGVDSGEAVSRPAGEADGDSSWWGAGKDLLADLGALVQIETDGAPPQPILSPELRRMMYEKAKLILESSQLAFLRKEEEVYAARMEEAKNWVSANFDTESETGKAWLRQHAALAAVGAETELPDISASLEALREVMRAETP